MGASCITVSSRADREFRFNTHLKTGTSYFHLTLNKLLPHLKNKKEVVKDCQQAKIEGRWTLLNLMCLIFEVSSVDFDYVQNLG